MEGHEKRRGFSKNILAVLLVLAIIMSVVGTYMSVTNASPASVKPGTSGGGHVGLIVVPSGKGHIGMVVVEGLEEKSAEESE